MPQRSLPQLSRLSPLVACALAFAALAGARPARAQVNGNSLALRSSGAAAGTAWTLSTDGYVGTYVQLSQPAPITFQVNASGAASGGLSPNMSIAIANQTQSFSVTSSTMGAYTYTTPTMPAGTYFVRVQLDNQTATQTPTLTVGSLTATGTGVSVANAATDANALSAAQSYINNFRQGAMNVTLVSPTNVPLAPGTQVQARLVQNAFSLGSATYDSTGGSFYNTYPFLTANASSTGNGALAYKFQQFLINNFNLIEPENAGKWASDEGTQGAVNMTASDQLEEFAEAHNMRFRQHNLIWHSQQPGFVNTLFTNNNATGVANAVTSRINYYVSGHNVQAGTLNNQARALGYYQLDVFNEALHSGGTDDYFSLLGNAGVANIFAQVKAATAAAGGNTQLFLNEYNVLQNSSNPQTSASDPYANWYRAELERVNNAGAGKVVGGLGAQLYATSSQISPNTMQEAMQNLAVPGVPFALTEFGIATNATATVAANDLQDAFTMVYGDPEGTVFNFWGFWLQELQASSFSTNYQASALLDVNGNPTALYTNTLLPMLAADHFILPGQVAPFNLTVDANGQVHFDGSYGTYAVTINGKDYDFTSSADQTSFTLVVTPEPASLAVMAVAAGLLIRRRKRCAA